MSEANEVPPHNADAEQELLGALLAYWSPEVFKQVDEILTDTDFYDQRRRIVWRAICAVGGQGGHVDPVTVSYFLAGRSDSAKRSYLDLAGGSSALAILVSHSVPHGIVDRARIIAKDGEWRRRLREAQLRVEACYARDEDAYRAAGQDQPRLRVVA